MVTNPSHRSSELRKGRRSIAGQIYLITINTDQRKNIFTGLDRPRAVVACMRSLESDCSTLAFVVMPDHIHWLIQLGDERALSPCVQKFKSLVSKSDAFSEIRPLWQRGFHDRALRAEEDLVAVARYIVLNPVRAGLTTSVRDYSFWDAIWL